MVPSEPYCSRREEVVAGLPLPSAGVDAGAASGGRDGGGCAVKAAGGKD